MSQHDNFPEMLAEYEIVCCIFCAF